MSLVRLVLTCLWTVSLGVFLVYLEAERVRMQHELLKWERLREQAFELEVEAAFNYWNAFQITVPPEPLLDHLREQKDGREPSDSQ